jgi:hypothetical protein
MTGFESKRQVAQDKVNDAADTLTIVYQRGFADGKKAAQRKPLTDKEIDALSNNIRTADPVTWWRQLARDVEKAHGIKEKNT